MTERVFIDTSVVIRYLTDDDPPRALAAARLLEGDRVLVVSGVVLAETIHAMRTGFSHANPALARALIRAATAEEAGCDWIATFDEAFVSPRVPSRLL